MKKILILLCIFGLCGCGRIAESVHLNSEDLSSSGTVVVSPPIQPEVTVTDPTVTTTLKVTSPPQTMVADISESVSESDLPKIETSAEVIRSSTTSVSTTVLSVSETAPASTLPTETVSAEASQLDAENFCTISIECSTVFDNWNDLEKGKEEIIPKDGIILPPTAAGFSEGESVFDVLRRVCRENKIHMESSWTPMYNSAYIEGIHNLYEFDCGSGSGWMYRVNGVYPNYGCSSCILKNGDVVEWRYTCDLGKDIGGDVLG